MTMYHIADNEPVACKGIFGCDAPRHYPNEPAALAALGVTVAAAVPVAQTLQHQHPAATIGNGLGDAVGGLLEIVGGAGEIIVGVVQIVADIADGIGSS